MRLILSFFQFLKMVEMKRDEKIFLIIGIIVLVAVVLWTLIVYNTPSANYDNFAKCLAEKGAVIYGTEWCSHCKEQKSLFGSSFQYVNYVDCDKYKQKCEDVGLEGYPTWIINNESYPGTQSLQTMSSLTSCPLS
jgi:glutaredoxin